MATRRITVEVEVPEWMSEGEVEAYLRKALRKLSALAEMEASREPRYTREVEDLLEEIRRGVARRTRRGPDI